MSNAVMDRGMLAGAGRRVWFDRSETLDARDDRRDDPRYSIDEDCLWLGWWRDGGDYRLAAARLVNISRGGALVAVADPPPIRDAVWICLGAPEPVACAQATVLEVRRDGPAGLYLVRVVFRDFCPEVFFHAAVDSGHANAPRP